MAEDYNLVLQMSENLRFHPIDYCTGVIFVVDSNYNFHRYLDSECVPFIIFAFLVVLFSYAAQFEIYKKKNKKKTIN